MEEMKTLEYFEKYTYDTRWNYCLICNKPRWDGTIFCRNHHGLYVNSSSNLGTIKWSYEQYKREHKQKLIQKAIHVWQQE